MQIGFGKPDAYFEVPEAERASRVFVNSDICDIDRERFFVRGVLQVPVHGHENFGWGIWAELGLADFQRYIALYEGSEQGLEPLLHGRIASAIPSYGKASLGIPIDIQLTGPKTRPLLFVEAGVDHPLAEEQRDGISVDRLHELHASIDAKSPSSVRCQTHGVQQRAYVCQHFSKTKKVGFFEPYDSSSEKYNPDEGLQAWCQECERILNDEGEWTDKAVQFAGFRGCCSRCFEEIKKLNLAQD